MKSLNTSPSNLIDSSLTNNLKAIGSTPQDQGLVQLVINVVNFLISVLVIPIRLRLRNNIGERSFSPFALFMSVVVLTVGFVAIFKIGFDFFPLNFDGISNTFYVLITASFIVNPASIFIIKLIRGGIRHIKYIIERALQYEMIHSYYRGDSKFFEKHKGGTTLGFKTDNTLIRMIVEPRFVFLLGAFGLVVSLIVFYYFGFILSKQLPFLYVYLTGAFSLSVYLVLSGALLCIEEFRIFMRKRGVQLDMIDSELDMKLLLKEKEKYKKESEFN